MPAKAKAPSKTGLFDSDAQALLSRLTTRLRAGGGVPGPIAEEVKKTCLHLVAGQGGTAFLGIHPRKGGLAITVRTTLTIKSPRIRKSVQASASRWLNDLVINSPDEIDAELLRWIAESYRLAAKIDA